MYVCICNAVTDGDIREAYADGVRTMARLQDELGVATCCGCCEAEARDVLASCQTHVEAAEQQHNADAHLPLAAAG